jgi:hypothetical protein
MTDVLERLRGLGVRVWAEGDMLKLDARRGTITPELRAAVIAGKSNVIAALKRQAILEESGRLPAPPASCALGHTGFWQAHDGRWLCTTCHPALDRSLIRAEVRPAPGQPRRVNRAANSPVYDQEQFWRDICEVLKNLDDQGNNTPRT